MSPENIIRGSVNGYAAAILILCCIHEIWQINTSKDGLARARFSHYATLAWSVASFATVFSVWKHSETFNLSTLFKIGLFPYILMGGIHCLLMTFGGEQDGYSSSKSDRYHTIAGRYYLIGGILIVAYALVAKDLVFGFILD